MSKLTPHGSNAGNHVAAKGRNLISRIRRDDTKDEIPVYRKFDGQVFRLQTVMPSIKEANYFIEEYKENFYIRKVRILRRGGRDYAVYIREKSSHRGQ